MLGVSILAIALQQLVRHVGQDAAAIFFALRLANYLVIVHLDLELGRFRDVAEGQAHHVLGASDTEGGLWQAEHDTHFASLPTGENYAALAVLSLAS